MAKRPTITPLPNGPVLGPQVNTRLDAIVEAFDEVLSRDGTTPNQMVSDLDLDSNDIINAGKVFADTIVIDGVDLTETITDALQAVEISADLLPELIDISQQVDDYVERAETAASNAEDSEEVVNTFAPYIQTVSENIEDVSNFAKVYLGPKSDGPVERNDGSALVAGDLYFNTSNSLLHVFDGSNWKDASQLPKTNFNATRAPTPTDDETQGYAPGSRWLWQGKEWVASLISGSLRWLPTTESLTPEHFGAVGDGVADDTAALIAWLENGGQMSANGTYLVASAGPDSGGAYAVLRNSIYFRAGPLCRFVAGLGLDNDMIRLTTNLSVYQEKGPLDIVWTGGFFDQTLQANSTSVPFSTFYPVIRPGSSGTTDGLYVVGHVESGMDYISAVGRCVVNGVTFYSGEHWQNSGGDSGLFIAGAKSTEVFNNEFIGSRDCGFYGSGFPSGPFPEGAMVVRDNVYRGCCMGAMVKRQMGKIVISGNRGFNTAEVVGVQGLTGSTGGGAVISGNIGENAWHVVRLDDTVNVEVVNNISLKHGHKMADGSAPTFTFNHDNAVVRLNGVMDSAIRNNTLYSVDPIAASYSGMSVVQLNGSSLNTSSLRNWVEGNRAVEGNAVVLEKEANHSFAVRNSGPPTVLIGAESVDADLPGVADATTTNGAAVTTTQTLKTITIPSWFLAKRLDSLQVRATGTFTGTSGTKTVSLVLQGVFVIFPDVAGAGEWAIEAEVISTSATSVRIIATLKTSTGVSLRVVSGTISASRPWTVDVRVRTHSAADTVTQTLLAVLS